MRTSKIACITVFIFVVSLIFSGYTFEKKDEVASDYIDAYEYYCLIEAANNILDIKEGDLINIDILYTLDKKPNYVLISTNYSGYIIFHRLSGVIIEMSFENQSQFNRVKNSTFYYAGPNNYFVKENNIFKNIISEKHIKSDDIETYVDDFNKKTKEIVVLSNKSTTNIHKKLKKYYQQNNRDISLEDWEDNPFYNDIDFTQITYILDYIAFATATDYGCFAFNRGGSCVYVALSLLLRYYDYYINDCILPDNLYQIVDIENDLYCENNLYIPQSWKNACYNVNIQDSDSNETYSMTIGDNFNTYEALHNYLICLSGIQQFGTPAINDPIDLYFNNLDCINSYSYQICNALNINSLNNSLVSLINQNIPVYTTMYSERYNGIYSGYHATITYGYTTANNIKYYSMHMGWQNCSNIIVPQSFLGMEYRFISDIDSPHNVFLGDQNTNAVYHYSCNNTSCFASLNHNYMCLEYAHICPCGECGYHTSLPAIYMLNSYYHPKGGDNLGHTVGCVECVQTKMYSTCDRRVDNPNWDIYSSHTYRYEDNGLTHSRICSKCEYVYSSGVNHTYIFGKCIYCGHRK